MVRAAQLELEWEQENQKIHKQLAEKMIAESQALYNESKQLLEEFWLKSGGLMKYLVDEEVFHYLNARREQLVYRFTLNPIYHMVNISELLLQQKNDVFWAEYQLQAVQGGPNVKPKESDEDGEVGEDLAAKIEKEAIAIYPEKGDIGELGLEAGLFGFNASLSYNGDAFELSVDTPLGAIGGKSSLSGLDERKGYTLYGVKAEANTSWFKNKKAVDDTLKGAGKLGEASKIGYISFGASASERYGEYITSKTGQGFIDKGLLHVREKGGEFGPFGLSTKTEVSKSLLTGVSIKSKTTKYKFFFVSITK